MSSPSLDKFQCTRCLPVDHEGYFCRCESRNMRIAKDHRAEIGQAWAKLRKLSEKRQK